VKLYISQSSSSANNACSFAYTPQYLFMTYCFKHKIVLLFYMIKEHKYMNVYVFMHYDEKWLTLAAFSLRTTETKQATNESLGG
jgi:hypothetical protein